MPRAGNELTKDDLAENRDAERRIQSHRADVEDTRNSDIRAEADEIDPDTPEYRDPDGKDGYTSLGHDLGPDSTKWHEPVPRKGKYGACKRLHRRKIPKLEDDKRTDGVKRASGFAQHVVEDLCDRLLDRRLENGVFPGGVAHDKT